jgi:hypothetical protein
VIALTSSEAFCSVAHDHVRPYYVRVDLEAAEAYRVERPSALARVGSNQHCDFRLLLRTTGDCCRAGLSVPLRNSCFSGVSSRLGRRFRPASRPLTRKPDEFSGARTISAEATILLRAVEFIQSDDRC